MVKFIKSSQIKFALRYLKRTVTHTPVTTTLDGRDDETLADGTPAPIKGWALRKNANWKSEKFGELDVDDGFILTDDTITINKNDKITFDGIVYRVKSAIIRYSDTDNETKIYTFSNLNRIGLAP